MGKSNRPITVMIDMYGFTEADHQFWRDFEAKGNMVFLFESVAPVISKRSWRVLDEMGEGEKRFGLQIKGIRAETYREKEKA